MRKWQIHPWTIIYTSKYCDNMSEMPIPGRITNGKPFFFCSKQLISDKGECSTTFSIRLLLGCTVIITLFALRLLYPNPSYINKLEPINVMKSCFYIKDKSLLTNHQIITINDHNFHIAVICCCHAISGFFFFFTTLQHFMQLSDQAFFLEQCIVYHKQINICFIKIFLSYKCKMLN